MPAIPRAQIDVAKRHLINVDDAAKAAQVAGCPFWLLCAVLEKESGGRSVFGHDKGGAFSVPGQTIEVTEARWKQFRQMVLVDKQTSNGVGPMQLTWPGFFTDMEKKNLRPWVIGDNMLYGARLLASYWAGASGTTDEKLRQVGKRYNGSDAYGTDLVTVAKHWRTWLTAGSFIDAKVTHFADLPIKTAYKSAALWQGATYAKNPLTGAEYVFQLQADSTGPGDIEDSWIHRYSLKGSTLTYLDSMRCKRYGHAQTIHVRISALGNTRVWMGVEVYLANKGTGTKVWRLLYKAGTATRGKGGHEYIYTGRGSVAPISSPAGWVVLRRPASDHEVYEWHKETELRKWRHTIDRPKPVKSITVSRSDGTYQSSCASADAVYRVNGATEQDSVLSQFSTDGREGRLVVTAAVSPTSPKPTSEEPEAVFFLRGKLTIGKRFGSVRKRVVAFFTVTNG